jgi:hypothetical protein
MEEGIDYYFNEHGLMVFTAAYHLKRGYCCKNMCKHCPWNFGKENGQIASKVTIRPSDPHNATEKGK